ncbi:MAG: type II secretion system F family protein, partial [Gammaproteobacteria bacterium]
IDELLNEVAEYYDREVDYTVAKLSAAIEPILTVVIGLMVLVLALGVFLPMWDLAQATIHHC